MDIARVARKHENDLLARANVVAVGVGLKNGDGPLAVVVSVTRKVPPAKLLPADLVPLEVDGALTDVVETGPIRALAVPAEAFSTERERPALGGGSIGHVNITAGTLGCVLHRDGQRVILSNNHVLANSNDAELGDPILQPGAHDGGESPADVLALLTDFVPITFGGGIPISDCPIGNAVARAANTAARLLRRRTRLLPVIQAEDDNLVDAAVARPLRDEDVSGEIRGIGLIAGLAEAQLGQEVWKSGRTTDVTSGMVEQVAVTVNVQYGEGRVATFRDQVLAGPMSQPGDSGSAVVDANRNLVGLLFAGSEQVTIFSRADHVLDLLDLTL